MIINSPNGSHFNVDKYPDLCPHCHVKINPRPYATIISPPGLLNVLFVCPNAECEFAFLSFYKFENNEGTFVRNSFGKPKNIERSSTLRQISEKFIQIYEESNFGEEHNLLEIAGVGYRKSLEFLIKDYCLVNNPDKKQEIQRKPLLQVINSYVNNINVKEVAKRAVWLGNDETHYVRLWTNRDIQSLKALIDLVIHWIEAEEMTKSILEEMPEPIKYDKSK